MSLRDELSDATNQINAMTGEYLSVKDSSIQQRQLIEKLQVCQNVQSLVFHHSISVFILKFFSGFLGWQQQAPIRGWWAFEREEIAWPPVRSDRERGRQKDRQNEVGFGAQGGHHRWAKVCDQIFANGFFDTSQTLLELRKVWQKTWKLFRICANQKPKISLL